MELTQIQAEHRLLINELTKIGAGYSLVERALFPTNVRNALEEREEEYGQKRLRKLCVAIMARHLILVSVNNRYFNYTTENHVHHPILNIGIIDTDIKYWMMFPREAYFISNPKYPMPQDLQEEVDSLNHA